MERIIGINPVTEALLNKEKNIEKVCLLKKNNYLWHSIKPIQKRTFFLTTYLWEKNLYPLRFPY